ncbi:MAG TPA: signal peptidase I [Chloroflexota bacterium]|nr:signal peptidase I [Chloroflexota bacterium]
MSSIDDRFPTQAVPMTTVPDTEAETESRVAVGAELRKKGGGLAWELLQTIVLTLAIFLGVRSVVQNFRVEGASMEPTLETAQYLLISKASYFHIEGTPLDRFLPTTHQGSTDYLFGGPQRGDVVVFKAPTQPDKDFIKRVIGLPGDTVLIKNGQVFVNGTALDEAYIHYPATYTYPFDGQPKQIPDGNYFVLGDNRPNSSDSHLGWVVPVDNLIGKAWISYWPPTDWGIMPGGDTVYAR